MNTFTHNSIDGVQVVWKERDPQADKMSRAVAVHTHMQGVRRTMDGIMHVPTSNNLQLNTTVHVRPKAVRSQVFENATTPELVARMRRAVEGVITRPASVQMPATWPYVG